MNGFSFGQMIRILLTSLMVTFTWTGGLVAAEPRVLLHSKVATDGDFLVLPVEMAGKMYSFAVDTGAIFSALDRRFEDQLTLFDDSIGEVVVIPGVESQVYRALPLTVHGTEFGTLTLPENSPMYCVDLSEVSRSSDQRIDGVLGMDFLVRYALQLDLARGELRLLDSETIGAMPYEASLWIHMLEGNLPNSDVIGCRPCLPMRSGDVSYWAIIDTGAVGASFYLDRRTREALVESQRLQEATLVYEVDGVTKVGTGDFATLRDVKLGRFRHYMLDVKEAEPCCKLGLPFWKRYLVTFDFPRRRLCLDKSPYFAMGDEAGHSGIFVEEADDGKSRVVSMLVEDCFAARHGVQVGDRLIAINRKPAQDMSVYHIVRRLSERRERVCELQLLRDDQEFTVTLPTLEKMFDLSEKR